MLKRFNWLTIFIIIVGFIFPSIVFADSSSSWEETLEKINKYTENKFRENSSLEEFQRNKIIELENHLHNSSSKTLSNSSSKEITYEWEPNDTIWTADFLPFGNYGAGLFQTYQDFDVFEVTLPRDGNISVLTATSIDAIFSTPLVLLQEPNGNLIEETNVEEIYDGTTKFVYKDFYKISAGTYYFIVANGQKYSENEYPYLFAISYLEGDYFFPDVNNYQKQIEYLTELGIIKGFPDGTFKPKDPVRRIQAVQMILNTLRVDPDNYVAPNPGFDDIKPGDYGYKEVAAAVDLGFIKGKENNTFDRYGYLTRGQMAAILVTAFNLTGTYDKSFADIPKGEWPYEVVSTLAANNITKGYEDNTFRPYNRWNEGTELSQQSFKF